MITQYVVIDRKGLKKTKGYFTEAEVRMAAKAGMRIYRVVEDTLLEITPELTGLFPKKLLD